MMMFYKAALKCYVVDNFLGFIDVFWRFMTRGLASVYLFIYFAGYIFLVASGGD